MDRIVATAVVMLLIPRFSCGQLPDTYMIHGIATCTEASGVNKVHRGDAIHYLAATTSDRMLAGWAYTKHESDGRAGASYIYIAGDSLPVSIVSEEPAVPDLTSIGDRKLTEVVIQGDSIYSERSHRFRRAQLGTFNNFAFAIFFSSNAVGVGLADVNKLISDAQANGGRASMTLPTGVASVIYSNGLRRIRLAQSEDDLITSDNGVKLKDVNYPPHTMGLKSAVFDYQLSSPFNPATSRAWSGKCSVEEVGRGGSSTTVRYDIQVLKYSDDATVVNRCIDEIVAKVPNGMHVVSSGPLDYVWKDGKAVKRIDLEGALVARQARFARSKDRHLLLTGGIVSFGLAAYLLFRWKRKAVTL